MRPTPPLPTDAGPAVDISANWWTTCSVRVDGRIVCWGQNSTGDRSQEPTDANFQSVSVGHNHACGLRKNGDIACWSGYNSGIDLREGPFVSVSSGKFHSCAIRENGTAECWLTDEADNYADSDAGQADVPADAEAFHSISAGTYHTCAVKANGALLCWGDNEFGQSSPPDGAFRSVSAGRRHTCGALIDGAVRCWGSDNYYELVKAKDDTGASQVWQMHYAPTDAEISEGESKGHLYPAGRASPPAGEFQSVSAGEDHTCGIRTDGSIACWGYPTPSWSNAGFIDTRQTTPPAGEFKSVSAGGSHSCAVHRDGSLICWGSNDYRRTYPPGYAAMSSNGADYLCEKLPGRGICRNRNGALDPDIPPDIPTPTGFTDIIAGALHTCALTDYAAIACWGQTDTPPKGAFRSIAHGCAVAMDGAIACWHPDLLENGISPPLGEFILVSGGQVYHGRHHFCGIAPDGSVRCWGYDFGNSIPAPTGTFRQISVHGNNACGIRSDDSLYCWEYRFAWLSDESVPQGKFQMVSVGNTHACAVRDNGRVTCWGHDGDGRASPPRGEFKSVSAGGSHSCGVKTDDTLDCWGANTARFAAESLFGSSNDYYEAYYGQAEPPEGTFQAVAAGEWHTCGIQTNGGAVCWGANNAPRGYVIWGNDNYYGQATPPAGNP